MNPIGIEFTALCRAWQATMIVTCLLVTAMALARVWDLTLFIGALRETLTSDI